MGLALSLSPSQAFVQGPEGKTHFLRFHPQEIIAKNLLRHSSQLHLQTLMELYILSGSQIVQADRTGTENGLHHEPHLKILLRCRGGMRVGPGAKAEDVELRKARPDKWEGLTSIRIAAIPRPLRGGDEAEVEETDQSKLNVQR